MPINKYINKIGLEIEGAWYNGAPYNLHCDGSVTAAADHRGESVSEPMATLREVAEYIRDNYPDEHNSSCGLHVHFSLNSVGLYSRLMDKPFQEFFLECMDKWAKQADITDAQFWDRLSGHNQYCLRDWRADRQAELRCKDAPRYCHWNFCHRLHGTAECRMLPVFGTAGDAVKAVRAIYECVTVWLGKKNKAGVTVDAMEIPEPIQEMDRISLNEPGESIFDISPITYKELSCV